MNFFAFFITLFVAVSCATASHLLAPAAPLLPAAPLIHHAPLAVPHLAAPALLHPAPILTAPAVIGHAPVLLGHSPVAASTHIGAPIGSTIITRPVATYSTTHTLLGAPLAAPALLARPAFPLAAHAVPLAAHGLPLAAPAIIRPWRK